MLWKENTRKNTSQKQGFLNILILLMKTGLPLMKRLLTPLAISVLLLLGLSAGMSAADPAIQKTKTWIRNYSFNNFKWRKGRYN